MSFMFIIGFIILLIGGWMGYMLRGMFIKEVELNCDMCLDYLRKRGYWIKLNVQPIESKEE